MRAEFYPYTLKFAFTAHTSRETFTEKPTFILKVYDSENPDVWGTGEVAFFPSLQPSFTDMPTLRKELRQVCDNIDDYINGKELPRNSAIRFGFESALADYAHGGKGLLYPSATLQSIREGITINGLVWMNSLEKMQRQKDEKIKAGFKCIKLKIGAEDFDSEVALIDSIRAVYPASELTLRVDANGAFKAGDVMEKLERLARYDIHSIEQPLVRSHPKMEEVCRLSPVPVALDEDMIERWYDEEEMYGMLTRLRPSYIIVKPSLIGGFEHADRWINVAESLGIGWWATSALESNVGLSAIAQWLATHPDNLDIPHGLGTGQIYTNNLPSNIRLKGEKIFLEA